MLSGICPLIYLHQLLDTLVCFVLNNSLRIFRVALLFICQGALLTSRPQLVHHITLLNLCQQVFFIIFTAFLLRLLVSRAVDFYCIISYFICQPPNTQKPADNYRQVFVNGEGGIWTLAPLLTACTLSRGVPSTSWVLLQNSWFHKSMKFSRRGYLQRRGWDSNPRALADKRFSRPPRYDHFDTSPCACAVTQRKTYINKKGFWCQQLFLFFLQFF